MKAIDRRLLFHLVDVVWGTAYENESVPSTELSREMIQKAIERRRAEKYTKQKLGIPAIMQAEGSDGCEGAAVGNSAAGQSGSSGFTCKTCRSYNYSGASCRTCGSYNH